MAIVGISHHTFTVSDMDESIPFFRDLLGFRLIQDKVRQDLPSYDQVMALNNVKVRVAMFMDPSDTAMLALLQFHHPAPIVRPMGNQYVGTSLLAVKVSDIDAEYERLVAAGVRFSTPPVDIMREGKLAARLTDAYTPDDFVVELYQPAES